MAVSSCHKERNRAVVDARLVDVALISIIRSNTQSIWPFCDAIKSGFAPLMAAALSTWALSFIRCLTQAVGTDSMKKESFSSQDCPEAEETT